MSHNNKLTYELQTRISELQPDGIIKCDISSGVDNNPGLTRGKAYFKDAFKLNVLRGINKRIRWQSTRRKI